MRIAMSLSSPLRGGDCREITGLTYQKHAIFVNNNEGRRLVAAGTLPTRVSGYTFAMDTGGRRSGTPAPRFVCDVMLGRLARWLRALGCDTAYDHAADDPELIRRALRERRILVTRDTRITAPESLRLVLLRANDTPAQLRDLVGALGLGKHPGLLKRCLVCNTRLRAATAEEVDARAPDHVRSSQRDFLACPGCGRVYWPGTHRKKLEAALEAALAGTESRHQ
jgi:hypothetical protein